jgi:hypothetical protein
VGAENAQFKDGNELWEKRRSNAMKKMLHAIAIAAIVILASLPSASADNVLLTCEQSDGWSYFLEGGMVTEPSQLGWKRGGIAGKLQLVVRDNPKALDLVASGGVNNFAYIADGCTMSTMPLALNKNETVIMALCKKHIEVFFFKWKDDGSGEVVSTDLASTPISNHGSVLRGPCKVGP